MDKLTFGALKVNDPYYNLDSGVSTAEKPSVHLSETKQPEKQPESTTQAPSTTVETVKDEVKPAESLESVIAFFQANPDKTKELLTGLKSLADKSKTENTKSS